MISNRRLTVKDRLLVQLNKTMNELNGVADCNDPRWRVWKEEEFVVRIYLNLRDLKQTVRRCSAKLDLVDLDHLMQTFRSPRMQWDIIDVGPGSEKADLRIQSPC